MVRTHGMIWHALISQPVSMSVPGNYMSIVELQVSPGVTVVLDDLLILLFNVPVVYSSTEFKGILSTCMCLVLPSHNNISDKSVNQS